MKRDFTRRRRDKGTQVNKRLANHTQGTKYGQKKSGLLGLLMVSDVGEGQLINKEKLMRNIYQRKFSFQEKVPCFIYESLKKIYELEPSDSEKEFDETHNLFSTLLSSSNLFFFPERSMWISSEFISQKALKFWFYKETSREGRPADSFSLKELPLKIIDFEVFKGSPPIAVLNLGSKLIGMTISTNREEQKQLFNYDLVSKVEKYVVQKDSIFVLLSFGNIIFGRMGDNLNLLDQKKEKFKELKLCGGDVLALTRNFIIKIISINGTTKNLIRAGIQISNVTPIYISTSEYILTAEQENKTCLLTCYKSGKNNYLQTCPEGLESIEETLYIGKWILVRTIGNKIYAFALLKDQPLKIYQIYDGILGGMLKILHRKLIQG